MEADYDVYKVVLLWFRPSVTSSQVLPSGINEDRMYIYNVCG